jgi:hypothetical protein
MAKLSEPSLYEWIEGLGKNRVTLNDKSSATNATALQGDLTLCNDSDNFVAHSVEPTLQERYKDQEPEPKQDPPATIPDPVPEGAELISASLQYLDGINESLTGWRLWKRIEQGREHRFATDRAGAIRWKRVYTQTVILSDGEQR